MLFIFIMSLECECECFVDPAKKEKHTLNIEMWFHKILPTQSQLYSFFQFSTSTVEQFSLIKRQNKSRNDNAGFNLKICFKMCSTILYFTLVTSL